VIRVVGEKLRVAATESKTTVKNLAESKTAAISRDREIGQGECFWTIPVQGKLVVIRTLRHTQHVRVFAPPASGYSPFRPK
jgi:hypothetical protein